MRDLAILKAPRNCSLAELLNGSVLVTLAILITAFLVILLPVIGFAAVGTFIYFF